MKRIIIVTGHAINLSLTTAPSQVKYLASTRKKLELKRVFLNKKPTGKTETTASGTASESKPEKPAVS